MRFTEVHLKRIYKRQEMKTLNAEHEFISEVG